MLHAGRQRAREMARARRDVERMPLRRGGENVDHPAQVFFVRERKPGFAEMTGLLGELAANRLLVARGVPLGRAHVESYFAPSKTSVSAMLRWKLKYACLVIRGLKPLRISRAAAASLQSMSTAIRASCLAVSR